MAMSNNWVWRQDGTLQCGMGVEQTLVEAAEELAVIIGQDNILNDEKRTLPGMVIALCGAPTGQVNAFELTDEGYYLLFHGFVGPIGYRPWVEAVEALVETAGQKRGGKMPEIKLPDGAAIGVPGAGGGDPNTIAELYGRICRTYEAGDGLTDDYIRRRVNIELIGGRIHRIWFG